MPPTRLLGTFGTAAVLLGLSVGCRSTPPPQPAAHPAPDASTGTVVAEIALQKGDCRAASEAYASAASHGSAALARRASEVSLACENMPAAWQSAERWHETAPDDRNAAIIYATVALKLYRIPDARSVLSPIVKAADPKSQADVVSLVQLLTDETDATATLAAVDGSIDGHSTPGPLVVAAGGLALQAYDFSRAERRAQEALALDASSATALRLLTRVRVLRGDASGAISSARDVMRVDASGGKFELAETLAELDRVEEARQELERLRASGSDIAPGEIDRRLALLAYESGDLTEAQHRFASLVDRGEAGEAALFYLADIAEKAGDKEAALSAYRQLADSSMAIAARTRAAGLLLDRSDRTGAMEMLDSYVSDHPESAFDLAITKAHLLADHGDAEGGVALMNAALERYPKHPTLEYERATMLERAGHVHESVQAFEQLLAERQEDPNLMNALGYTMADHGLELARAETLIRRALSATPDNPAVLDSLAWVRLRRGDARGAVAILERAYGISRDPEIAAHWGEALWQSGSQAQARKVWAAALARHPDSAALKATVHRLLPPERS
jgi:tetratricopeptide (TPR) repeat protein